MRYERGVDDNGMVERSAAAAALIAAVSGGTVVAASGNEAGVIDVWEKKAEPVELAFRIPRFQQMMGDAIPRDFIVDVLERLGCSVSGEEGADELSVVAPTFRPDLEREIDLYEEVLRLHGMDRIPPLARWPRASRHAQLKSSASPARGQRHHARLRPQ